MKAVTEYAKKVLAGEIQAGNSVKKACKRHLDDLKKSQRKDYPYYFDEAEAEYCFEFAEKFCVFTKGSKWAGQPLILELWQKFIVGSVFGWKRKDDDTRRFRYFYIQVARKNGKSTLMAFIGVYCLVCDGEEGAEIYSAATSRDQAKIIFDEAKRMVEKSEQLSNLLTVYTRNISFDEMNSFFRPVSSDAGKLDGLNVHVALIDELHAHKTSDVYDVLNSAKGSRVQPIIGVGTTAGFVSTCFCKTLYDIYKNVLNGTVEMDDVFIYIAELDEGDEWDNPDVWAKANPNLGISVFADDMQSMCNAAKNSARLQIDFKVKKLNMWITAGSGWANIHNYNNCPVHIELDKLLSRKCYIGLDLANRNDLCSAVAEFPLSENKYACIHRSFIPEDKIDELSKEHQFPYRDYIAKGYITATPGSIVDYEYVENQVREWSKIYEVLEVCLDPWSASQVELHLSEEFTVVEVRQGYQTLSEPIKDLEGVINNKNITHYDDPVLKWAVGNVVITSDPAGNVKTDKAKSSFKIDPAQALIIAHTRCYTHDENYPDYNEYLDNYFEQMGRLKR